MDFHITAAMVNNKPPSPNDSFLNSGGQCKAFSWRERFNAKVTEKIEHANNRQKPNKFPRILCK